MVQSFQAARARLLCGIATALVLTTGCDPLDDVESDDSEWIDEEVSGEEDLLQSCSMELSADETAEPRVLCFDSPEAMTDFFDRNEREPQVGLVLLARLYQHHAMGGARFDIKQYGVGCPARSIPALSAYGWDNRASGVSVNSSCMIDLYRYKNYSTRMLRLDGTGWNVALELTGSRDNATSSLRVFSPL